MNNATVEIDHSELTDHYYAVREMLEGQGDSRGAANAAIDFLFEMLGEPGAGE